MKQSIKQATNRNRKNQDTQKPLLSVLKGNTLKIPPVWLMRQAGRYLPEYRKIRTRENNFLAMVYNPKIATEITLQPVHRFGMDAAILFSDILVVPDALGQKVSFTEGKGPQLEPLNLSNLSMNRFDEVLSPVYETVSEIRSRLDKNTSLKNTSLIGFAGAPWTVACYMVEGKGSRDFINVKNYAYNQPKKFKNLLNLLIESTTHYLNKQIESGAEIIQIFDSWAGVLDTGQFRNWVIEPTRAIIENIRKSHPDIPIIGFPRGAGQLYKNYVEQTGVTAVSLDYQILPSWAADKLQPLVPVQGNLDPARLLAGGDALKEGMENIMKNLSGKPFIFNLGHGVHKDTPPEHITALIEMTRA